MGEKQNRSFQLSIKSSLKAGFRGSRITSNGGSIPVRDGEELILLEKTR